MVGRLIFTIDITGFLTNVAIMFVTGLMFALWVKPFMDKKCLAYQAGVLVGAVSMFILYEQTVINSNTFIFVTAVLGGFSVIYFGEKKKLWFKLFLCVVFMGIRYVAYATCGEIRFLITELTWDNEFLTSDITVIIISFFVEEILFILAIVFLMYFAIRLLHGSFPDKDEEMTWRESVMLGLPVIPILLMAPIQKRFTLLWNECFQNGMFYRNYPFNVWHLIFSLISYLVILVVVRLYRSNKNKVEELTALALADSQRKALEEHISEVEMLYREQNRLRHDMANHIQTIESLIRIDERESYEEYLSHLKEELSEITPGVRTGNPVTDVVLSRFQKQAENEGVCFTADFHYPKNNKEISAFDISVILNNALSNAVRECVPCENPYIEVKGFGKKNIFMIIVKNNCRNRVELSPQNGMPRVHSGQGIGLKNISHIAKKYHGTVDIAINESGDAYEFCLAVMITT